MLHSENGHRWRAGWAWLALWAALIPAALILRPLLPVDETRYLSIAWEMWRRHDWLVPYVNGAPYSDKPPLFFWSILLGWRVFGVNEWWPRLLSPLYSVLSVLLLARLASRLSAKRPDPDDLSILFLSGALWVAYSTLLLFDTLLTLCVLLALSGVVAAWRGRPGRGWLAYGLGVGLGVLTKGPVVLVHVLPVAALAPWWASELRPAWTRWYVGLAAGLGLGAAIGLSWALAAGARGGPEYRDAILWHQTTGRVFHAFIHQRPWWWYLPLLPVVLFPWILWPPLWRALAALRRSSLNLPMRLALAWIAPGFILLSAISGKQVHYLIPLLPGFAILAGAAYARGHDSAGRWDAALPAGVLVVIGAALLVLGILRKPWWAGELSPGWALVPLLGAVFLYRTKEQRRQLLLLGLTSPALVLWMHFVASDLSRRRYDLRPAALFLKGVEDSGRPVAYVGHYAGQFHFLGRLERPLDQVTPDQLGAWGRDHPGGLVIREERHGAPGALRSWPYRDGVIAIRSAVAESEAAAHGR